MPKNARKRRRLFHAPLVTPGAPPGLVKANPDSPKPVIRLIAYGPNAFHEETLESPERIVEFLGKYDVAWVDIDGFGHEQTVLKIGEIFGLHRLALEDVVNGGQRPKLDTYEEHLFIVAHMLSYRARIETEQLSVFLGKNFVVTMQERAGDCLDPIRNRLRHNTFHIRSLGPDHLAYALLDTVIDNYFPALEKVDEAMEAIEEDVSKSGERRIFTRLHEIRRDLQLIWRVVWPLRDVVNRLQREEFGLVSAETRTYLRDLYDHIIRAVELVEVFREHALDLRELYFSFISHRMNDVMLVLTIISTLFIPLTFVVGVYGMNFNTAASPYNMPELNWRYGYLFSWAIMGSIVVAMLYYFYRKGWLSRVLFPRRGDFDVARDAPDAAREAAAAERRERATAKSAAREAEAAKSKQ